MDRDWLIKHCLGALSIIAMIITGFGYGSLNGERLHCVNILTVGSSIYAVLCLRRPKGDGGHNTGCAKITRTL
ncbi:hypothetical protein PRIPAC_92607, partial [Pristionchus pacificus]|uniref:Uncharacterized protein n=1 Tax=Pristionchus pacificus TaxID=54126 RepID=A0A2A6CHN0_PRIPA